MAALLILISFLACTGAFSLGDADGLRGGFLKAAIVHGLVIAIGTELLSTSRALNVGWVVWLWSMMALLNSLCLARLWYRKVPQLQLNPTGSVSVFSWQRFRQQPLSLQWCGWMIAALLGITLLVAIVAPPNNYDSLSYHMPRVMHWIQNQSIAHYPTPNLRQISFPPLSAYIVTHLYLLAGGDYFVNLVQWLAFLGCIVGTSLIARHLHVSETATAVVCATPPMAVLQAMTTQNDLVVAFWLVCFLYYVYRTETYAGTDWLWLAGAIGLAILTKPTGILVGAPLVALLGYRLWGGIAQWRNWRQLLRAAIVSGLVMLTGWLLSLPSYGRNLSTFGTLLGIDTDTRNTLIGVRSLLSNVLKTLALNLPIDGFWRFVQAVHHHLLQFDVDDPRTSYIHGSVFDPAVVGLWRLYMPVEDFVANPLHQILVLVSLVTLLGVVVQAWRRHRLLSTQVISLAIVVVSSFLLMCLLLKWQIWANRLLLPLAVLSSPVIAHWLGLRFITPWRLPLLTILGVVAIGYSLTALYRPIVPLPVASLNIYQPGSILQLPRELAYFNYVGARGAHESIRQAYRSLVAPISRETCRFVALESSSDAPEYLVWATLKATTSDVVKLQHVKVNNESASLPPEFPPEDICLILSLVR